MRNLVSPKSLGGCVHLIDLVGVPHHLVRDQCCELNLMFRNRIRVKTQSVLEKNMRTHDNFVMSFARRLTLSAAAVMCSHGD